MQRLEKNLDTVYHRHKTTLKTTSLLEINEDPMKGICNQRKKERFGKTSCQSLIKDMAKYQAVPTSSALIMSMANIKMKSNRQTLHKYLPRTLFCNTQIKVKLGEDECIF